MLNRIRVLGQRVHGLLSRRRLDEEFQQELDSHLEMLTEENLRRGLSPDDARRTARVQLGGMTQLREIHREQWTFPFLETLVQDVRYGLRQLRRNPGFTTVAVLTLALGIGATTAIFSVLYDGFINPWPYKDSGRLAVLMLNDKPRNRLNWALISAPEWLDFKEQSNVFSAVFGGTFENGVLTGSGPATHYFARIVTPNSNHVLGVAPLFGRDFTAEDAKPGAPPVVLLNYQLWQKNFGGDPSVLGKTILLNRQPTTVVGVLPKRLSGDRRIYLPGNPSRTEAPGHAPYYLMGRLKQGVSFKQAEADIAFLAKRFASVYPNDRPKGAVFTLKSFTAAFATKFRRPWEILLGMVGLLLLIACVNVANLLLARATKRQHEIAIRAALGAGRLRLVRQFLVESLLLSLGGAGIGFLFARASLGGLLAIIPSWYIPNEAVVHINGAILLFTLIAALLSTLIFGLAPALLSTGRDPQESLKAAGRGAGESAGHGRLRNLLVVSEVALSLVLLTAGGLLIRSFLAARYADLGYDTTNLMGAGYDLPEVRYKTPEQRNQFNLEALRRVRALPGVVSATLSFPRMDRGYEFRIEIAGKPSAGVQMASVRYSGDRFFQTLGIPLLQGRTFSEDDLLHSRRVALVNRAFVNKYFAGADPLGQKITVVLKDIFGTNGGRQGGYEIIGVVGDTKPSGMDPFFPMVFINFTDRGKVNPRWAQILMRFKGGTPGLAHSVHQVFVAMDKELPVDTGWTPQNGLDQDFVEPRMLMTLLVAFALLGLVLASVGVVGVLSYSVSQRTQEIGVRMALGAQVADVRRMVLTWGLRWLAIGIGIGVPASIALEKILRNRIWGIKSADPLTLIAVSLVLTIVGLLACYIPAHRAAKVDPMVALRYE